MNWGVLMGWSAVTAGQAPDLLLLFSSQNTTSNINFFTTILPLYSSGILWTLIYDTIYAHQDKADDAKVGVKSTALTFGNKTKAYLSAFAVGNMGLLAMVGQSAGCGLPYYASVLGCGMHLAWQICSVDLDNGVDCMRKFVSNKWYGGMLFAGIAADKLLLF
jgi:4-hydroxybenzoate polyprenyltransferase